jgi:hypothetical protein
MSHGRPHHDGVKKGFKLQPEWDEDSAIAVDELLTALVKNQTVKQSGTYHGTGALQAVSIAELPHPPIFLMLQKDDGSTPHFVLMPIATGSNVIAWGKRSFTLAAGSSFNTAEATYLYLVIA